MSNLEIKATPSKEYKASKILKAQELNNTQGESLLLGKLIANSLSKYYSGNNAEINIQNYSSDSIVEGYQTLIDKCVSNLRNEKSNNGNTYAGFEVDKQSDGSVINSLSVGGKFSSTGKVSKLVFNDDTIYLTAGGRDRFDLKIGMLSELPILITGTITNGNNNIKNISIPETESSFNGERDIYLALTNTSSSSGIITDVIFLKAYEYVVNEPSDPQYDAYVDIYFSDGHQYTASINQSESNRNFSGTWKKNDTNEKLTARINQTNITVTNLDTKFTNLTNITTIWNNPYYTSETGETIKLPIDGESRETYSFTIRENYYNKFTSLKIWFYGSGYEKHRYNLDCLELDLDLIIKALNYEVNNDKNLSIEYDLNTSRYNDNAIYLYTRTVKFEPIIISDPNKRLNGIMVTFGYGRCLEVEKDTSNDCDGEHNFLQQSYYAVPLKVNLERRKS